MTHSFCFCSLSVIDDNPETNIKVQRKFSTNLIFQTYPQSYPKNKHTTNTNKQTKTHTHTHPHTNNKTKQTLPYTTYLKCEFVLFLISK